MIDLPDLNVWLAFSLADHEHHSRAQRYWAQEASAEVAFCRLTALGLVRLLTQPAATGGQPFSVPEAWEAYASFRRLPEILLLHEPADCEAWLETWARAGRFSPRLWSGAYLAAFCMSGNLRMVSFDHDLERFEGLRLLNLSV